MAPKESAHRKRYRRNWARNKYKADPKHREKILTDAAKNRNRRYAEHNKAVASFKKNGCRACKERTIECLCAHHRSPANKLFNIGGFVRVKPTLEELKEELKKCICLCHNCHAKLHARKRKREKRNVGQQKL